MMRFFISIVVLAFLLLSCEENETAREQVLEVEYVHADSANDIRLITGERVEPVLYQSLPDFGPFQPAEMKELFISAVLPAILVARYQLATDRARLLVLDTTTCWTDEDSGFYLTLAQKFGMGDMERLQNRLITHPNSIALAQAVIETGWGSSRFFQEANNMFGMWSFNPEEPRIAANIAREDQIIYLRKYADLSESIRDYYATVARSRAYRNFRAMRIKTKDVNRLLPHLRYYSEMGDVYVAQLAAVIRQNDLMKYDDYQLDPDCFAFY